MSASVIPIDGATKRCPKCEEIRWLSEFPRDSANSDGLHGHCKRCHSARHKNWYQRARKHVRFDVSVSEKRCPRCSITKPASEFARDTHNEGGLRAHCKPCVRDLARIDRMRPETKERMRRWRLSVRRLVIAHYGGCCACCGEAREQFLALDHIGGGGNKHRRAIGNFPLPHWLVKNGLPEGFRVLCHNCNMAAGFYGVCPHQLEKSDF